MPVCSLSGKIADVRSRLDGSFYARSALESYWISIGEKKCPMTGQPMTEEDLEEEKKSIQFSSFTGALHRLEAEYNASQEECTVLRREVSTLRTELSTALYRLDAACRIIARLQEGTPTEPTVTEVLPEQVKTAIIQTATRLKEDRKAFFAESENRRSECSVIDTLELQRGRRESLPAKSTLTTIFPLDSERVLAGLDNGRCALTIPGKSPKSVWCQGHGASVLSLSAHGNVVASGGADGTCILWSANDRRLLRLHELEGSSGGGPLAGVAVLPTGQHVISCSVAQAHLTFFDVETGLSLYASPSSLSTQQDRAYTADAFALHPDGILALTADANNVRLWDLRSPLSAVHTMSAGESRLCSLSVCNDGWSMMTGSLSGIVEHWDLRQGGSSLGSLTLASNPILHLSIDHRACTVSTIQKEGGVTLVSLTGNCFNKLEIHQSTGFRDAIVMEWIEEPQNCFVLGHKRFLQYGFTVPSTRTEH